MSPIWKKLDLIGTENFPFCLEDHDICYYARDYTAGGGYAASTANQLVSNLKKSPDRRGRPEWKYKQAAITQFAQEISCITNIEQFIVTCVPSSKVKTDPLYDSRMEDVLRMLKMRKPRVTIEFPFSITHNVVASHQGGPRSIDVFYAILEWSGLESDNENIIIVDDVITSGAHFKACKRMILENVPDANVIGLFWARSIWP